MDNPLAKIKSWCHFDSRGRPPCGKEKSTGFFAANWQIPRNQWQLIWVGDFSPKAMAIPKGRNDNFKF